MFPPPALVPLVLPSFLMEHATGQFRHLILVALCWMEAPWLPNVLNMLAHIPWCHLVIKDLIMDVLVGHMLKGLPYLHLTFGYSKICVAQTGVLFLSLSGSGGGQPKHIQ